MRDKRRRNAAGFFLAMAMTAGMLTGCGADIAQQPEAQAETEAAENAELPAAGAAAQEQTGAEAEQAEPETETAEAQTGEDAAAADGELAAILADPTLGGLFELYTPEEYAEVIETVKKYADGGSEDVKRMEEDLEKLKADNGRHEFVLYKSAFDEAYEENGYMVASGFNPISVMNPWQEYERAGVTLTPEAHRKDIENTSNMLNQALEKGKLTQEQKELILAKMNDNLQKM